MKDTKAKNAELSYQVNDVIGPALEKANKDVASLKQQLYDTEIWIRENKTNYDRTLRLEQHFIHVGAHEDFMYDMYFEMAMELSAEVARLNQKVLDAQKEGHEQALMIHAEDETRLAMYKNPKAFKDPPRKKKKGGRGRSPKKKGGAGARSKSPKKKGGKKGGGSKSPSKKKKGASKSPKKGKKKKK